GGQRLLRCKVNAENLRERGPVGHAEEAEGADLPMQIDGGQAFAENAVLEPATVDPLQLADGGDVQILDRLRTGEILAMMDVLDHHETDERLVGMMMVEGEFHQPAQRVGGAQMLEIELGFGGADLPVGLLEDGQVE